MYYVILEAIWNILCIYVILEAIWNTLCYLEYIMYYVILEAIWKPRPIGGDRPTFEAPGADNYSYY